MFLQQKIPLLLLRVE